MTKDIKGNLEASLPSLQASGSILHEHEVLLKRAEQDLNRNEYSLSIIMSHAAIELCTERTFKLLFDLKNIEYLYEAIVIPSWKFNNLSKNSQQARRLFTTLTDESFDQKNPLWKRLEEHFKTRHGIAHRGTPSTKQEAKFSILVARSYIAHINDVLEKMKPTELGI